MTSIKDMMFHLSELRRENDDLKEQIDHHLAQQRWFMQQIDGLQQEYGACYHQYSLCSLELYNIKNFGGENQPPQQQPVAVFHEQQEQQQQQERAAYFQQQLEHQSQQFDLYKQQEFFYQRQQSECHGMLEADVESYARERQEQRVFENEKQEQSKTLLEHYKTQLSLITQKSAALEAEVSGYKDKVSKDKQQLVSARKKLKECQEEGERKDVHIKNQKDTIHRLQNNTVVLSEKLAVTEGMLRETKKEVGVATDLFNEMSVKCTQIKNDQARTVKDLNQTIISLRATNTKMVQKAVEQAKMIKNLNGKMHVTFQMDSNTTEEVIREGYNDLQKFVEKKATQMEHVLALVAYALTHLKFVLERFVHDQTERGSVSVHCDFLNQVINQITRIFLIIPIPVMLRNLDRLTELAAEQSVSMKALHLIQYTLPQTVDEAQASRQRIIIENFPELNEFFTTERATNDETICMSVPGFMMLIGISK